MKTLIQSENSRALIIAVAALMSLALLPNAQAVSPAPDGGYPGGNTAEGQAALLSLTSGGFNTAIGYLSLRSDTTNSFNTAIGAGTLFANTADLNTAIGAGALLSNTTGSPNTANGAFALFSNLTGGENTAIGTAALFSNMTGEQNTALGDSALSSNTGGGGNTAIGLGALHSNINGTANNAFGSQALASNVGNNNMAVGSGALFSNTNGSLNVAVGNAAGSNLTTGNNNIDIGFNVQGVAGESNTIRIGNTDITTTIIRGISGQTIPSGATVLVSSNGQLGTMTSSERFKADIKPMDKASETLLALRPVTFRYKKEIDPKGTSQFGLVAEEVEKVNPDLVVRDEKGKPYSVRYDQVNAMLLNEFLREHRKNEEQQSKIEQQEGKIARQQKQIEALTAGLQKVSAALELGKPTKQVAENNQ
jgi:hypothetical protein